MKKIILAIACCATLLSISSVAYSAEGLYVSGNLGLAIPNNSDVTFSDSPGATLTVESNSGLALAGAIGYGLSNNVRLEAEVAYQKNDMDKMKILGVGLDINGDTSSLALLLNGYYDFKNKSAFTPFIGGGIGIAKVNMSDVTLFGLPIGSSDDDTVFAYQVGAGVSYAVNEKVSIDVKYRYFATSDPEFGTSTMEYSSHNIYAGVRVAF